LGLAACAAPAVAPAGGAAGGAAGARVVAEDLTGPGGAVLPAGRVRWHFQGFVPLEHNSPGTPDSELVRKAPCRVPDVLLADRQRDLPPGEAQPVWLAVDVPRDAVPGEYRGAVSVVAGEARVRLSVHVHVYDFELPQQRHLWVTNWFSLSAIARAHRVELWSEPFWEVLQRYARAMAEHRQNVVLVPLDLVEVTREAGGKLAFDFSRFDRFVRVFQQAGAGERLELGHVASHGEGGWSSREILFRPVRALDQGSGQRVALGAEEGLAPLLRALEAHLRERGWLERALIHIADEPAPHNLEAWRRASEFVHRHAPNIPRIDAIEATGFHGALEVWVPKLSHLNTWYATYRDAQRAGAEMWFYTCCHPTGFYPNRFLDYSLLKTRVLHWLNFAYDLPGYLHWGLNFWGEDPFGAPRPNLPPGDTHICYPGREGPLSSLRWEAMREGIEDFELLRLLAERTGWVRQRLGDAAEAFDPAEGARAFARCVVPGFADFEHSPEGFQTYHRLLCTEIEEAEKPPLLLVKTNPPGGSELVPGPIVVLLSGVVQRGAVVRVNGSAVPVDGAGRFEWAGAPGRDGTVVVEAALDGQSKRVVRHFRVRKERRD
ncbi:MAG: DUF4091 domain-containing protein, partial [Armatimonadota bacterium]|nr:DUF4091 domain-containing protein [Armatimonadota bacterium]